MGCDNNVCIYTHTYICRDKVMMIIVKAMKNPRSALCKTSIMASSDIFKAFADKLLDSAATKAFDQLVCMYNDI